ncbi:hypothetical protein [Salsipaludibacter albus]|uniref:hypothetical protein n=1 Tax=Salsipaludibacter albus TaxID=2849650 RepID=UPI001EE4612A|nr:hypothetical protein [Salsipaludibacter albus]MBY5163830.1 hypothetical protein [Salsipaludibacter albus]
MADTTPAPSARSTLADQRTSSSLILVSLAVLVRTALDGFPIVMVVLPVASILLSLFAMWLSRVNYTEREGRDVGWRHPRSMFVCATAALFTSTAGLLLAFDLH